MSDARTRPQIFTINHRMATYTMRPKQARSDYERLANNLVQAQQNLNKIDNNAAIGETEGAGRESTSQKSAFNGMQ
ncbi:hypothetical protein ACHAPA_011953 [Fusarium lateritium]